jgi:hypothetical protein
MSGVELLLRGDDLPLKIRKMVGLRLAPGLALLPLGCERCHLFVG